MTLKTILSAVTLAGLISSAAAGAALADGVKTLKPIQGLTFEAGAKHAVGYFTNDTGKCHLVITLAGEPDWDRGGLEVTRYEAIVAPGQSQPYAHEGQSFLFRCGVDATVMTFESLNSFANAGNK